MKNTKNLPSTTPNTPHNNEPPQTVRSQSVSNSKWLSLNICSQLVSYDASNPQQTPHTFHFQPSQSVSNTPYNSDYPQQTSTNANPQKQPYNTYCDDYDSSSESILSIQSIFSKMSGRSRQQQTSQQHSRQSSHRQSHQQSRQPSRQPSQALPPSRYESQDNDGNRSSPQRSPDRGRSRERSTNQGRSRERSTNQDAPRTSKISIHDI